MRAVGAARASEASLVELARRFPHAHGGSGSGRVVMVWLRSAGGGLRVRWRWAGKGLQYRAQLEVHTGAEAYPGGAVGADLHGTTIPLLRRQVAPHRERAARKEDARRPRHPARRAKPISAPCDGTPRVTKGKFPFYLPLALLSK